MATQSIRLPAEFLTAPDQPVMDVDLYIDELENYLLSADEKILKAALTSIASVSDVYELLLKLFPSSLSITLARQKFNNRVQSEGESVMEFFSDISNLSNQCNYGKIREDLVRDKLLMRLRPEIKQKLTLEQPVTLQSALGTAQCIETIVNELRIQPTGVLGDVNAVSSKSNAKPSK